MGGGGDRECHSLGWKTEGDGVWQGQRRSREIDRLVMHYDFEVFVGVSCRNDCKSTRCLGLKLRKGISIRWKDLGIDKKQMRKIWPRK